MGAFAENCCKGCADRAVGCHSSCPRYASFRGFVDSTREAERRANELDRLGRTLRKGRRRRGY